MKQNLEKVRQQLRNIASSQGSNKAERYCTLLDDVISSLTPDAPDEVLVECLKEFIIKAIVDKNVNLRVRQTVLKDVSDVIPTLSSAASKTISLFTLEKVQTQVLLFEEQVAGIRKHLAGIYEKSQNCGEAANVLLAIPLETGTFQYPDDEKLKIYLDITRYSLTDDNLTQAKESFKKASLLQGKSTNKNLRLLYKLYEAKILDHQGKFIEAATRYYELTREKILHEGTSLRNAMVCAVLAKAGKEKSQLMDTLCKDKRFQQVQGYSILDNMHHGQVIRRTKTQEFENLLQPHQKAFTNDGLGLTIFEQAVIEHNLHLACKKGESIDFVELSKLLEFQSPKVEKIAAKIIANNRIVAEVDCDNSIIHFNKTKKEEPAPPAPKPARKRRSDFGKKRGTNKRSSKESKNSELEPGVSKKKKFKKDTLDAFIPDKNSDDFATCSICNERVGKRGCDLKTVKSKHLKHCHKDLNSTTCKVQNVANEVPKESPEHEVATIEETARLTVINSLTEALQERRKEAKDLKLKDKKIAEIALKIELALYELNKDVARKYSRKFRSLVFNIKDPKNLTLFREILDKTLSPEKLVKLNSAEMASRELSEWRENEVKRQLEIIEQSERDLLAHPKSNIIKTHKGEREIENVCSKDYVDMDTLINSNAASLSDNASIETEKGRRDKGKNASRNHFESRNTYENKENQKHLEKERSFEIAKLEQLQQLERELNHLKETNNFDPCYMETEELPKLDCEDSDVELIEEDEKPFDSWQFSIRYENVTEVLVTAREINGQACDVFGELPNSVNVGGRVVPPHGYEYFEKVKDNVRKELIVLALAPASDEQMTPFLTLCNCLNNKNRLGLVFDLSKRAKHLYLLPVVGEIPPVLQALIGGANDKNWLSKVLLGVLVLDRDSNAQGVASNAPLAKNLRIADQNCSSKEKTQASGLLHSNLQMQQKEEVKKLKQQREEGKSTMSMASRDPRLASRNFHTYGKF